MAGIKPIEPSSNLEELKKGISKKNVKILLPFLKFFETLGYFDARESYLPSYDKMVKLLKLKGVPKPEGVGQTYKNYREVILQKYKVFPDIIQDEWPRYEECLSFLPTRDNRKNKNRKTVENFKQTTLSMFTRNHVGSSSTADSMDSI